MIPLTSGSLPELAGRLATPSYDRSELSAGIVHIGVGGFHRAHQAVAVDDLLNQGKAKDWAICGVGLLPGDSRMRDALNAQDCLYSVTEKHPDGTRESRVIGSIIEYLYAPDDPEAVIEKIADQATRIVSLTVTEGGYNIDRVTGQFMLDEPAVSADLARSSAPATTFGIVCEALRRRRDRGVGPLTVQSCDNVQGNGDVARRVFSSFARALDEELAAWIEDTVAFPNSMVDRITPVTSEEDRAELTARTGIVDAWPVVCEPFFQWAIEDTFACGRPPFEDARVQMVSDVEPYELMKLRLLNAGHQAIAYFGTLAGYRYAHEAAQDGALARFVRDYMDIEATPTLRPVPGVDLDVYKTTLIERFANAEVRDTLARLAAESSDRIPTWLVPVIRENLAASRPVLRSAAIVASWARYAEGVDEHGEPIVVVDRDADRLTAIARTQRDNPTAFIENRTYFGDLADDERFVTAYTAALTMLIDRGARATIDSYLPQVAGH